MNCPIPRRWLASLVVAFAAAAALAKDSPPWFTRAWQSDEGLPDNTVVGVEQTPDGFLWVATQAGLVRFDGLRFRQFAPVTVAGVPTSLIQAIFLDRRGRLWVAKERGTVVCVDQGRTTAITSTNGLPKAETRMMVEDAEGAVWVSYIGGEVVRIQDGGVRSFTAADGLPGGVTCQLAIDKGGQLWFSGGEWVGVFRKGKFLQLETLMAQRITGARAGGIWVCTGKQVFRYNEGSSPVKVGNLPVRGRIVNPTVLYEDRAGRLWIGTKEEGLFSYDSAGFAKVITSHQEILSVMEDREGNFWVGTRGGGLNQLKPRVVELLTTDSSIPFEAVRSVCQDTAGLLWAVAQNGVVSQSAGNDWAPLSTNDGWSVLHAQCVAADPQGGVWIGTQYKGLHRWQNGAVTTSLSKTNGLGGDFVSALLTTPSGEVWIGTESVDGQRHALQRLQAGQFRTFDLPPESGPVVALAVDAADDCWAATSRGLLLRVRQDLLMDETRSTLTVPQAIRCLFATSDGSLWIGYAGEGLGRLKAGRFSHYRLDQGLHDDYISHILADGRDRLWLAGNRGVFSVFQEELDDLAAGRASRVRSVAYGQNEGLPRLQASHGFWPGAVRSTDGRLWFAMQSGLAVVLADSLAENPEPPSVVIERVSVNGKTLAAYEWGELPAGPNASAPIELSQAAAHLRLSPGQRQVESIFTALSFTMPESIGFKYRLQGLDADWVEAGTQRVASYPRIPPGDYLFQVLACSRDGVWNETGAALALSVEPYWWEITWFRVLGLLTAIGLLVGGILLWARSRHRRQVERLELLHATEQERTRIAADLHDDLGSNLTQIAYLGDTLLSRPGLAPELAGDIDKICATARDLTRSLDATVWAVDPKLDTLDSLAGYLAGLAQELLSRAEVNCRLDFPETLPPQPLSAEVRHHLFLAVKEAIHNIIRHARATEVNLQLAVRPPECLLVIADNGCGFEPEADGARRGGGHGLNNIRQRLAAIGGRCEMKSQPGAGTELRLTWSLPA